MIGEESLLVASGDILWIGIIRCGADWRGCLIGEESLLVASGDILWIGIIRCGADWRGCLIVHMVLLLQRLTGCIKFSAPLM